MSDRFDLDRFLRAQDGGTYEAALDELKAGEKRSHWIWFVFPQIAGLGSSSTARKFALSGREEAAAYCAQEELGSRLVEAVEAMLDWAGTMPADAILGSLDAMKFRSSMTLFDAACPDEEVFGAALDAFFDGERDPLTLEKL